MPEPEEWQQVHVEQPSTGATLAACFHSVKTQHRLHRALPMQLDAAALLQRNLPLSATPRCLHDKTHRCKLPHAPQERAVDTLHMSHASSQSKYNSDPRVHEASTGKIPGKIEAQNFARAEGTELAGRYEGCPHLARGVQELGGPQASVSLCCTC